MEDNIQTILAIIISAFLLFIFPVYMAYEKKDDVSYALAVRYTQNLVDNVRSKGYITKEMYDDYSARLKVTGNSYDIEMTHEYKRYDPITNYYTKDENDNLVLLKTSTQKERSEYIQKLKEEAKLSGLVNSEDINEYIKGKYEEQKIYKIEDTYKVTNQKYTSDYIKSILYSENKLIMARQNDKNTCKDGSNNYCVNAYIMNVGDAFNITIKNSNTTLATFIYNMVTANTLDTNTRIYVNYGGDILSTKWYGNIDYSVMDHYHISLTRSEVIFELIGEKVFENEDYLNMGISYNDEYELVFDVLPADVTELREKGEIGSEEISGYNFAVGNGIKNNDKSTLSVSVGINGISLLTNKTKVIQASTTGGLVLPTYNHKIIAPKERIIQVERTEVDEETGEEVTIIEDKVEEYDEITYEPRQRNITDYSKIKISYNSGNKKIKVELTGKTGVDNYNKDIEVSGTSELLNGLNVTINNPEVNTYTGTLSGRTNSRGTDTNYIVTVEERFIKVSATRYDSNETVMLSEPLTIDTYTNIRIDVSRNKNERYTAKLYVDDEFVNESIEFDEVPTVNAIGESIFGAGNPMFFKGKIKDLYVYQSVYGGGTDG